MQLDSISQSKAAPQDEQFLTFCVLNQEYAIQILLVQEIKEYTKLTPLPGAAHYVPGVMNLRGAIIPVVDLRARLNMPTREYDKFSVIIIISLAGKLRGLLVDSVSDVVQKSASEIEPSPDVGGFADASCVRGIAQVSGRMVVVLNIENLIAELGR